MKIKLSREQIDSILKDPEKAQEAGVTTKDPWWLIVLKVIAYALGLLIGGTFTMSCAASYML